MKMLSIKALLVAILGSLTLLMASQPVLAGPEGGGGGSGYGTYWVTYNSWGRGHIYMQQIAVGTINGVRNSVYVGFYVTDENRDGSTVRAKVEAISSSGTLLATTPWVSGADGCDWCHVRYGGTLYAPRFSYLKVHILAPGKAINYCRGLYSFTCDQPPPYRW